MAVGSGGISTFSSVALMYWNWWSFNDTSILGVTVICTRVIVFKASIRIVDADAIPQLFTADNGSGGGDFSVKSVKERDRR